MSLGKIFKRARSALLDWAIPEESLAVGRQRRPTTSRSFAPLSYDQKHSSFRSGTQNAPSTSVVGPLAVGIG